MIMILELNTKDLKNETELNRIFSFKSVQY